MKSILFRLKPKSALASSPGSKQVLLLFLIPLILYYVLRTFETDLTSLIIPYFPDEPDKSFGFYRDFLRLCFNEMLWLSFFGLVTVILFIYAPLNEIFTRMDQQLAGRVGLYTGLIMCLSLLAVISIAYYTLATFPNSGDEYVYLYQAQTMSEGKLWNDSHPMNEFFPYSHIAQKDGISVGRFPPGWPVLLTIPYILEFPAFLLNPMLGLISLIVFYRFAKRYYSHQIAFWAVLSLAFTAFFMFNSASYFSHTACMLFALGFVFSLYLHLEKHTSGYALLAGVFLGLTLITRYYNAVLIFLPVIIFLAYQYRWKSIRTLFLIGLGGLPFMIVLFWYDLKITGNGLLPVTVWADARERLGFGVRGYTPIEGIEHFIRRVMLFLYWCSPALLLFYFLYLYQKVRDSADRFLHPEDYFVLMMMVGYFFYYHIGGNQYGPRFWFEGMPFLVLFVVKKVLESKSRLQLALFAAGIIYCVIKLPYIIDREHQVVAERMDIYRVTSEEQISNAVVLISSHTGIIRPMGVLDLPRNGIDYSGEVIYAIDKPGENHRLMEYYPDRTFYRYIRDPDIVKGKLVRVNRSTFPPNSTAQ